MSDFSTFMLNPENRPLLGIYSDEGVGFEHGGPRGFGMLALSTQPQPPTIDNPQQSTSNAVPKKRSFVSSNPFCSMEEQRTELENQMKSHVNGTVTKPKTTLVDNNPIFLDPVQVPQEYYKRRIETSRKRANQR
eukprot:scaffold424_cov162-Amphora_coffeaeformis.AAC.8